MIDLERALRKVSCSAEEDAGIGGATDQFSEAEAEGQDNRRPPHRARDGHSFHGQQIVEREVQPDAEHQEDYTDFRELECEALIGDVTGGEGPSIRLQQCIL